MDKNDQILSKKLDTVDKQLEDIVKQSLSLEKQLQPLLENNRIMEQSSALTQLVSDYAKTMRPLLKLIEESSKLWSKPLEEITDLIQSLSPKYISEEQYAILVNNAKQYGKRCWGIHPDFPHDIIIQDPKNVDSILEECKNNAIENTNTCLSAIEEEIEKDYRNVIEEAIICFNSKCYRACCCLLISQIDRIFQSFSMKQFSTNHINSLESREKINQMVDEKYDVSKFDISKMLIWVSLKETLDIVYGYIQFKNYTADFDAERINRHTVQHGYSQHAFNEMDCLQMSTILYSLITMVKGWGFTKTRSFSMLGTLVKKE